MNVLSVRLYCTFGKINLVIWYRFCFGSLATGGVIGRLGRGELSWGGALSAAAVRRIACDAGIRWIITNTKTECRCTSAANTAPQHLGNGALTTRDGGCVFPGCTRPIEWTETHHVV